MLFASIPSEVSLEWVYLPPMMITVLLGFLAAYGVTKGLSATGLSQYVWHPEIAFLGFWLMLTSLIGLLILPP
jgi:hypothetical protein